MPFKSLPHPKEAGAGAKNTPQKGHRPKWQAQPPPPLRTAPIPPSHPQNTGPLFLKLHHLLNPISHKAALCLLPPPPGQILCSPWLPSLQSLSCYSTSLFLILSLLQILGGPKFHHLTPTLTPLLRHLCLPPFTVSFSYPWVPPSCVLQSLQDS